MFTNADQTAKHAGHMKNDTFYSVGDFKVHSIDFYE